MPNRRKRIKALEEKAAKRFADENCICHPWGVAQCHTNKECNEARKIPCPVHGIPVRPFGLVMIEAMACGKYNISATHSKRSKQDAPLGKELERYSKNLMAET